VRIKSYTEAVRLANLAGEDAANRRMRKAGRKTWTASDYDHAVKITESILVDLGFDTAGWIAMAGVPRNEPDVPKKAGKPKRKAKAKQDQLGFAFG
jgi:hypothetical protein